MAIDARRRQKKLEKRAAKQKAERKALATRRPDDLSWQFRQFGSAPILDCRMAANLFDNGLGNVLLSRQLPNGKVAWVAFLLDVFCVGVKNAVFAILPPGEHESKAGEKLFRSVKSVPIAPEFARKLVEGAVEFAAKLGIAPHADYQIARLLFGEIDAAACEEEIVFGQNGRPLYISGPFDSPAKIRRIMSAILDHGGRCELPGLRFVTDEDLGEWEFEGQ